MNFDGHYYFDKWSDPEEFKSSDFIIATEYKKYSEISQRNWFDILYFPNQWKIIFRTTLNFGYNELEDKKLVQKFLSFENDTLSLNDHPYYFELSEIKQGKNLMYNLKFLIKIPNTERYLRSVPTSEPGISTIEISAIDSKNLKQFYFHLAKPHMSNLDIRAIDKVLSVPKKFWIGRAEENIEDCNPNNLATIYKKMKESMHNLLRVILTKEPNTNKSSPEQMCINCKFFGSTYRIYC